VDLRAKASEALHCLSEGSDDPLVGPDRLPESFGNDAQADAAEVVGRLGDGVDVVLRLDVSLPRI
jgi:hypothetical protein